jgi:NAD(P)-dependent dehydrogenase (short-subunit alcohol dehydrogenase family)
LTNGSLDYLIANAAWISQYSEYDGLYDLGKDHVALNEDLRKHFEANIIGNINLFNLFLPLVLKGSIKKVIAISSGMADIDLIAKFDVANGAPYSISKAGLNAAVAKFSSQFRSQGVLFMSISPGLVDTAETKRVLTDEQKQGFMEMAAKFATYAPHFTGPITPEESVKKVLSVINKASIEDGYAGAFISHLGNKQWL